MMNSGMSRRWKIIPHPFPRLTETESKKKEKKPCAWVTSQPGLDTETKTVMDWRMVLLRKKRGETEGDKEKRVQQMIKRHT